jgi:hypothetical protein
MTRLPTTSFPENKEPKDEQEARRVLDRIRASKGDLPASYKEELSRNSADFQDTVSTMLAEYLRLEADYTRRYEIVPKLLVMTESRQRIGRSLQPEISICLRADTERRGLQIHARQSS